MIFIFSIVTQFLIIQNRRMKQSWVIVMNIKLLLRQKSTIILLKILTVNSINNYNLIKESLNQKIIIKKIK